MVVLDHHPYGGVYKDVPIEHHILQRVNYICAIITLLFLKCTITICETEPLPLYFMLELKYAIIYALQRIWAHRCMDNLLFWYGHKNLSHSISLIGGPNISSPSFVLSLHRWWRSAGGGAAGSTRTPARALGRSRAYLRRRLSSCIRYGLRQAPRAGAPAALPSSWHLPSLNCRLLFSTDLYRNAVGDSPIFIPKIGSVSAGRSVQSVLRLPPPCLQSSWWFDESRPHWISIAFIGGDILQENVISLLVVLWCVDRFTLSVILY